MEESGDIRKCIDSCFECEKVCKETTMHCLHHGGEHAEAGHIGLMIACAAVCKASAEVMIADPEDFAKKQCKLCAEICTACAEECEQFEEGFMQACSAVCIKCAETCSAMSESSRKA